MDVAPHVGEARGVQRYDPWALSQPRLERELDIPQAGGADLALVLGEDVAGREFAQPLGVHVIDGEPFAHELLHARLPAARRRVLLRGRILHVRDG